MKLRKNLKKEAELILFLSILVSLTIILPIVSATNNIHNLQEITVNLQTSGEINIVPTQIPYSVKYVKIWLYSNAENDFMQQIINEQMTPQPKNEDDALVFTWENPDQTKLQFNINQNIKITSKRKIISKKVNFPLMTIPQDVIPYIQFTDHIDNSKQIQELANNLAQNEDDLFLLENKIASWVNENIKYNLSTLNSEANIASSQVLIDKNGVCDEITNLFISINRALGIPARFVSGIAHTDSKLFKEPWGNHGWAEIYFPNIGWIPYDVTYDEFAVIDPTHIALQKNIDGTSASIKYKSLGNGFKFGDTNLKTQTKIIQEGAKKKESTKINLNVYDKEINFGSYNLISAKITNPYNYYQSKTITLAQTNNMKILGEEKKQIALKPGETKTVYWIIQVNEKLNRDYIYTFPITIQDELGYETKTEFKVDNDGKIIPLEELKKLTNTKETSNLKIDCQTDNNRPLLNTTTKIICSLEQIPKTEFPIKICLDTNCKETTEDKIEFTVKNDKVGIKTYAIKAEGKTREGTAYKTIICLDEERINISNLQFPKSVNSNDEINIDFIIKKESISNIKNLKVNINSPLISENWTLQELKKDQEFELTIPANNLAKGENKFKITYTYTDQKNKVQKGEKIFEIKLDKVEPQDWPEVLINTANYYINEVFHLKQSKTSIAITIILITITIGLLLKIIGWIVQWILK